METKFTKDNLIENIDKVGAWSQMMLAEKALCYYFPDLEEDDGYISTSKAASCLSDTGLKWWSDVIIKYHEEVGFNDDILLLINEN